LLHRYLLSLQVLGPLEFVVYTENIVQLTENHNTSSHLYADDTQLYASCRPEDFNDLQTRLSNCITDLAQWCASHRLQLNADKTEAIWFGSRANLRKLANHDCSVCVGSESIQPATVVRDLGTYLDAELTINQHDSKIAATSFFHLCRLRQISRRVGTEVTIRLVLALITSRLDYCKPLLAGTPQSTLGVLQRVQNAAARLIFELGPRDHVTDSLIQLHWLPIRWRVQYKLVMLIKELSLERVPSTCELSSNQLRHHIQGFVRQCAPRQSSSYRVYAPSAVNVPSAFPAWLHELTACRHPVHDEQTNFQNITEISFLPSSFWYFIVTANCYC